MCNVGYNLEMMMHISTDISTSTISLHSTVIARVYNVFLLAGYLIEDGFLL